MGYILATAPSPKRYKTISIKFLKVKATKYPLFLPELHEAGSDNLVARFFHRLNVGEGILNTLWFDNDDKDKKEWNKSEKDDPSKSGGISWKKDDRSKSGDIDELFNT